MSEVIPEGYGVCPVCNGSKRKPAGDSPYVKNYRGYDEATHTMPCTNCGAQTMYGQSSGVVPLRADGQPCKHEYEHTLAGNCYHRYTCNHCNYTYYIDSGD